MKGKSEMSVKRQLPTDTWPLNCEGLTIIQAKMAVAMAATLILLRATRRCVGYNESSKGVVVIILLRAAK
jgi:hypothetical protein